MHADHPARIHTELSAEHTRQLYQQTLLGKVFCERFFRDAYYMFLQYFWTPYNIVKVMYGKIPQTEKVLLHTRLLVY